VTPYATVQEAPENRAIVFPSLVGVETPETFGSILLEGMVCTGLEN